MGLWKRSIVNHMYYVASHAKATDELSREDRGHVDIANCLHAPITENKLWILPGNYNKIVINMKIAYYGIFSLR